MPRLHSYRNRDACYVLTSIGGGVVTYQLTPQGVEKLKSAGIESGMPFLRSVLLELIRAGEAFTHGSGANESAVAHGQMELDLIDDPVPETALPMCGGCAKAEGLHLVLSGPSEALTERLLCPACRGKINNVDTSIPLSMVTLSVLVRLRELKAIHEKHASASLYEELLRADSSLKWDELKKQRAANQGLLFGAGNGGELL